MGVDGSVCSPFPFLSFPESMCFLVVLGVVSCIWCGCFWGVSCMFVLLPGGSVGVVPFMVLAGISLGFLVFNKVPCKDIHGVAVVPLHWG